MRERVETAPVVDCSVSDRALALSRYPLSSVTIVDPAGDWSRLEQEWRRLAAAHPEPSCFASPEMFQIWHRQQASDVMSRLIAVHDRDELVGVMPIMRAVVWRGPSCVPRHDYAPSDRAMLTSRRPRPFRVRQISPVVSVSATYHAPAPLAPPSCEAAVIEVLARAVVSVRDWDVVIIPTFNGNHQARWGEAFASQGYPVTLHRLGRTIQAIGNVRSFTEIVADAPRKFRQNVRRAREAASHLDFSIRRSEGPAAVARELQTLEAIAQSSWKHRGRPDTGLHIPYGGRQKAFFEELVRTVPAEMQPVLWIAHAASRPIAALLCMLTGSTITALLTFRDTSFPNASPGLQLVGTMIDWSAERGLKRIDFNATHEWLRHLCDERRAIDHTVVFANTVIGQAYRLLHRMAQRRT